MSISDFAPSAVTFRHVLTVVVISAIAASAAVIAPVANADRADARSLQSVRIDIVTVGIASTRSNSVRPVSPWLAGPSSILFVPTGVAAAAVAPHPTAAVPAAPAPSAVASIPKTVVLGDFLSLRDVRLEADARAAAKLKAEHEAATAAAAAQAAAVAAAQAAAQVAAQAAARAAADAATRAAQGFVQRVWTSGFQNEINQCRGAVDVTAVYRVRVIAEHSSCGGGRFPTAPGAIVTIIGLDSGRYRVIGVVARLNGEVNHAEDIPRGYDLLFQTCVGGFTDMRFTALERIG